jgi:hypothetical protein
MALGPNLTTVAITGTYLDFEGNAIEGQIRFSVSEVLRNGTDDQMIAPSSVVVPLQNGSFSAVLPATNDPDVVPRPFTYSVEESFSGGRSYSISIPYTSSGSLDLADISPDPTIDTTYVQLIDETTWNTLATNINTLDGEINQTTDTILASGKYWYIPSAYASYTNLDTAFSTYTALTAAQYQLTGSDINGFTTSAQAYSAQAVASATTAQNNSSGTINPLLLIGG